MPFLRSPWLIGIAVWLVTFIGVSSFQGPRTCEDGWHSMSIGRQGACSHHGGVDHTPGSMRFFISLLAGFAAGWGIAKWNKRLEDGDFTPNNHMPPPNKPVEAHGSHREQRNAEVLTTKPGNNLQIDGPPRVFEVHVKTCPKCSNGMRSITLHPLGERSRLVWQCLDHPNCQEEELIQYLRTSTK
jgi:hypothetical protein